jgi:cell division septation protein DedD
MTIDLSTMSPKARAEYVRIGRQYGSTDTLAQANQTLTGLGKCAPELVRHGFSLGDSARLAGARDGLEEAGVGRIGVAGNRKVTNHAYVDALAHGKAKREDARSILDNGKRALRESTEASAETGVNVIKVALEQTRSAGADGDKLADQLDTLSAALSHSLVAPELLGRGGPEAVIELQSASGALRATSKERAGAPGTPAETEQLNLLDGIIVGLVRGARKAARAAAKRLGTPALVADFELTKLYASRGAGKKATPAEKTTTEKTPPGKTAPEKTAPVAVATTPVAAPPGKTPPVAVTPVAAAPAATPPAAETPVATPPAPAPAAAPSATTTPEETLPGA